MRRILFLAVFLLLATQVSAQGMLITNSQDWTDVYSVELFGNLMDIDSKFLTGTRHATILHYSLPDTELEVISSDDNPIAVGYDQILQGQGFGDVEESTYNNVNLELARRLQGIDDFIIVDDSYGYNALAVAPFASRADYYVLFADDRNIASVGSYLGSIDVDNIIIYGQVDREVKDELAQYNPETINEGDRFQNNIEIVKKYLEINPTKQVILTNGEFIEQSLMDGYNPVMFIGRTNVPDPIRDFIQQSDIEIGILVGNELIGTATIIRRQIGISVFVKFAQGARTPGGAIAAVEDLDRFPMPSYQLNFGIISAYYNQASGNLEVTYRNNAEIATYFKSTINIYSGDQLQVVGDDTAVFIDGEEFKTILYEVDLLEGENASAEFFTIFGESTNALEFSLEQTMAIEFVEVMDDSEINVTGMYYDAGEQAFYIEVRNVGYVDAYVDAEILEVWINGELVTVGGDEVLLVEPGKKGKVKASVELAEEDIANARNQDLEVKVYYGERENALIKMQRATFAFELQEADYTLYILIAVVLVLFFLILWKRRKKKEKEENNINVDVNNNINNRNS